MASFCSDKIKVRVLEEVAIVFWKPRYIIVVPHDLKRPAVMYSIPFLRHRDYTDVWKAFRRELWRGRRVDIRYCNRKASRSDGVIQMRTLWRIDLGEKPVEIIHGKWSLLARKGELK